MCDLITPLNQIQHKKRSQLTYRDVISLTIHAIKQASMDPRFPLRYRYSCLLNESEKEMIEQTKIGWPQFEMVMDITFIVYVVPVYGRFISTRNILTLLQMILYIENAKRLLQGNQELLNRNIQNVKQDIHVPKLNLQMIFQDLYQVMHAYLQLLNNGYSYEPHLAATILELIGS